MAPLKQIAPAFSDEAMALAFADRHGPSLRYVALWGSWMSWTGAHWRSDSTLHAYDLARQIARETATGCNHKKTAAQIASAKTVAAIEKLAKADRRIAATEDQWDCKLSAFNATTAIDLETGIDHPPNPIDYHTKIAAIAQAPEGTPCPMWMEFLHTVTGGDAELVGSSNGS